MTVQATAMSKQQEWLASGEDESCVSHLQTHGAVMPVKLRGHVHNGVSVRKAIGAATGNEQKLLVSSVLCLLLVLKVAGQTKKCYCLSRCMGVKLVLQLQLGLWILQLHSSCTHCACECSC